VALVGSRISHGAWPWEEKKIKMMRREDGVEMGRWIWRGWMEETDWEEQEQNRRRRLQLSGTTPALGTIALASARVREPQETLGRVSGREMAAAAGPVETIRMRPHPAE
jgi:hypothetical protein